MAKRCLIETCKREAETHCYHCSQNVCTKHYLEHKKWTQEQLHPLVDEINFIYDRLNHGNKNRTKPVPQYFVKLYSDLDKWRVDCYASIDNAYNRTRSQIESLLQTYHHEEFQKETHNVELLEKIREQIRELLKEGDVTYRQLETMKQQLEEFKRQEEIPIKCPNVRLVTQRLDIDKYVNITTEVKYSVEKQQQPKSPQKTSLNK